MINITVNATPYQFDTNTTLQDVLTQIKSASQGIAVAVNNEVVSKSEWKTKKLNNNDSILLIKATQGG